jgi:hypothetical protein
MDQGMAEGEKVSKEGFNPAKRGAGVEGWSEMRTTKVAYVDG